MTPYVYSSKCPFESLADIKGKKITVMGLGLNGGGTASAIFLARYGAQVCITDMKTEEELFPSVEKIRSTPDIDQSLITFALGGHKIEDFENADCVIKNPGVKIENNVYLSAAKAIETDISLFLRFTKAPVIAVTGSKGKSSTVSAIHYGLCKAGFEAFLGGNITVSPLNFLEKTNEHTPVVLELSSWQLADLRGRGVLKPKIAVITTIVPDHQNWYGAMEPYVADKKLIYADQDKDCYTLCKYKDEWGSVFARETKGKIVWHAEGEAGIELANNAAIELGENEVGIAWVDSSGLGKFHRRGTAVTPSSKAETLLPEKLSVPGTHMKENLLKAGIVLRLMGVPSDKIAEVLASYSGIPHRLEAFFKWQILRSREVRFYNDSAATVPEATIAAINSFEEKISLICGGTDKDCNFEQLAQVLVESRKNGHLAGLYLLDGTGTQKLLGYLPDSFKKGLKPFDGLEPLLQKLKADVEKMNQEHKDLPVVVFSPGATSFGMFKNEFDRGNTFKDMVTKMF